MDFLLLCLITEGYLHQASIPARQVAFNGRFEVTREGHQNPLHFGPIYLTARGQGSDPNTWMMDGAPSMGKVEAPNESTWIQVYFFRN